MICCFSICERATAIAAMTLYFVEQMLWWRYSRRVKGHASGRRVLAYRPLACSDLLPRSFGDRDQPTPRWTDNSTSNPCKHRIQPEHEATTHSTLELQSIQRLRHYWNLLGPTSPLPAQRGRTPLPRDLTPRRPGVVPASDYCGSNAVGATPDATLQHGFSRGGLCRGCDAAVSGATRKGSESQVD